MDNALVPRNLPANLPSLEEIFDYPQYTIRGIKKWSEVIHLGKNNIEQMIYSVRHNKQSLSNQIKKLTEYRKLLEGKSGEDFIEMAKQYENPKDIKVGVLRDNLSGDEEPIDPKSQTRKRGATNLNICGWCDYASGGTGRYSYMIATWCSLERKFGEKRNFNSPCMLLFTDKDFICRLVDNIKSEIDDLKNKLEIVRMGIKTLQRLKEDAIEKPYLMTLRPHDLFNVGDEVVLHLGNFEAAKISGAWTKAMVVFGYRHHDGCVSYQTNFPFHHGEYLEGRGGGLGMSRPECLLTSEFEYLRYAMKKDKTFFAIWIKNLDTNLEGFSCFRFKHDILFGKFAKPPIDWEPPTDEIPVNSKKDAERVLCCLDADLFKTEKEIQSWAKMQLQHVHPDKLNGNANVKSYAERQTTAIFKARDFLIKRLRSKKN